MYKKNKVTNTLVTQKFLHGNTPNSVEQNAYNLTSGFKKSRVSTTDDDGHARLNSSGKEFKLNDLLHAIFICTACVLLSKLLLFNS